MEKYLFRVEIEFEVDSKDVNIAIDFLERLKGTAIKSFEFDFIEID